jgi:hypothetical protein
MKSQVGSNELKFIAEAHSTAAQKETLAKMLKIGWQIDRVVEYGNQSSVALSLKGCAGWLLPTGKFERAALGKKSVSLDYTKMTVKR